MTARILPILFVATVMAPHALADPADVAGGDDVGNFSDNQCLLNSSSDPLMRVTESANNQALELKVAAPESAGRALSDLDIGCDAGSLESVTARLAPRQETVMTLLVQNRLTSPLKFSVGMLPSGEGEPAWLTIDPASGTVEAGEYGSVRLEISVPGDISPGTRYGQILTFIVDAGQDRFSQQVPMHLEVQEKPPLFRDGFEVDPVIGQFSFRIRNGADY